MCTSLAYSDRKKHVGYIYVVFSARLVIKKKKIEVGLHGVFNNRTHLELIFVWTSECTRHGGRGGTGVISFGGVHNNNFSPRCGLNPGKQY